MTAPTSHPTTSPIGNAPAPIGAYALLRPLLFLLQPETAHHASFAALDALEALRQWLGAPPSPALAGAPLIKAGLHFPNRVGLAAGLDKEAAHLDGLARMGFGFLEVGTVTPVGQPGNPRPRMFRIPEAQALINRLGFNNRGLDVFLHHVAQSRWAQCRRPGAHALLGLNIGKNAATPIEDAARDYLLCLRAVAPVADYVTVNISSPNTQNLRSLQSQASLASLVAALAAARAELADELGRQVPILIKIAPDLDAAEVPAVIDTLCEAGMDGVISSNTTVSRQGVEFSAHAQEAGGLSGRPLGERAMNTLRAVRAALPQDRLLVAVGGIDSVAAAQARINAGADAVQIYTGLIYRGPGLVGEVVAGLTAD